MPTVPTVNGADRAAVATSVAATVAGQRPQRDDRFRAVDNDRESEFIRALAAEAAAHLEGKPAHRILAWAAGVVPRFVATSSFGAESVVLLHMLSRVASHIPVVFLDTGFHFAETLEYRRLLAEQLRLTVLDLRPELSVEQQAQRYGPQLYRRDPESCCRMRKTIPLRTALSDFDGWATGVRRVQTPQRAGTPTVEGRRLGDRWLVKVAPLAAWTDDDVEAYIVRHDLPRHPLSAQGYRSIGCAPCTRVASPGEGPRSGRWSQFGKTECGIHLTEDGTAVRQTTTPG
ncbi:MAG: phosphoadenylyl-sulfate reductase [Actinomycetota bacterium]|nr:phosphoadenylyl-sulfate reductase [Actinomycetota bacterium]